jgi:hypothetical protein
MCFSATASFTASALLLLCSVAAFKRARKNQYMIAAIPLLFSIQQFFEGFIWVGLAQGTPVTKVMYIFLFFAAIVWPLWIPFSLFNLTTKQSEKRLLIIPFIAAAIVVIAALSCFINYPIHVQILHYNLVYTIIAPPQLWLLATLCYLTATLSPFFIVSKPLLWVMGSVLGISYLTSIIFYYKATISVWCFFAAILSVLTLLFVG